MSLPSPPRTILVVVTRRIGDVLLATPLIRSLRHAWPAARIDALVFEGTQGALSANPDVRSTLVIAQRPRFSAHLVFVARLFRRYDMALSLVPGDRPTFYAWAAGRWRAGLLLPIRKESWKRCFLHRWVPFDDRDTHTVSMHLALAEALGIAPATEVVVSWSESDAQAARALLGENAGRFAVLHPYPKFNYKMWRRESWIELARWLAERGYRIVLSGGPDAGEVEYVATLARDMPPGTLDAAGRLSLGASAALLSRASLYVGPDTAVTHMAAALGIPTVALFGPTDPVKWAPWPKGHALAPSPWRRFGSQSAGCVRVVQGDEPCVPCGKEGCERHVESFSDCLQRLPPAKVIAAIQSVMK